MVISRYCLWIFIIFMCLSTITVYQYFFDITRFNFKSPSQNVPIIYPYIAFIVDDRATQQLVDVVINVLQYIPNDWKVQIFTHIQNWPFYKESFLSPFIKNNRVFMMPIDFPRNNMSGADFINLFLTSVSLWRRVQGDKALYFQIDSVICSNSSYKLTDFLQYDFVGAPWIVGGCCNGGFSIRSRTKILQMLESGKVHYPLHRINEDGWYTRNLPRFNGTVAPVHIARTFSVETIYHSRPFAVHNPRLTTIGRANMNRLCNDCPETKIVFSDCQKT
jgi:hypothetical protein